MAKKEKWETEEVIKWLINDENAYTELRGMSASAIKQWVLQENAPAGLYKAFKTPPTSSFNNVDWNEVAESLE